MRPFEGKYMYVIRGDGDFQPKRRQYFFSKILNYIRLKIESTFIENSSKILYRCASLLNSDISPRKKNGDVDRDRGNVCLIRPRFMLDSCLREVSIQSETHLLEKVEKQNLDSEISLDIWKGRPRKLVDKNLQNTEIKTYKTP